MNSAPSAQRDLSIIKWLTFFMFTMFAMTTDSVGVIIPEVIKEFHLSMTVGGAFHYAAMSGIAFAGFFLGYLADKIGRKKSIILGLVLFALNSYLFSVGRSFAFFVVLLVISGVAIGIFKTGALALIGDISQSTVEHTATMNTVEGFFAVGAIIVTASFVQYPQTAGSSESVDLKRTLQMMKNPYALGFSAAIFLYVTVESAVYVWMPTLLAGYQGRLIWVATYAISIFFILRAAGRFIGSWVLARLNWATVVTIFSLAILLCFGISMFAGVRGAILLLPLSGLFMSVLYPTLNSKGISCFRKPEHGAVSGVILFFTCVAAVLGPLAMGAVSDHFGDPKCGFVLATVFAALLFVALLLNQIFNPARNRLQRLDHSEYELAETQSVGAQARS